jgi:hypothetical protein
MKSEEIAHTLRRNVRQPSLSKSTFIVGLAVGLIVVGCGSTSSIRKPSMYSSNTSSVLEMGGMILPNETGSRLSMEVVIYRNQAKSDQSKSAPVMVIFSGGTSDLDLGNCPTAELVADGHPLQIKDFKYQKNEIIREANLVTYRTATKYFEEVMVLWLSLSEFRSFIGAKKAESRMCDRSFQLQSWQSAKIRRLLASADF